MTHIGREAGVAAVSFASPRVLLCGTLQLVDAAEVVEDAGPEPWLASLLLPTNAVAHDVISVPPAMFATKDFD